MQQDVDTLATAHPILIFGVNQAGQESGNASICAGRVLPWLQDVPAVNAWDLWHVTWRDVVVLDPEGKVFRIYNLTVNDLGIPANYDSLKGILLDEANWPYLRSWRERNGSGGCALRRVLGRWDATCVVVGAIIGVGIFFNPRDVANISGSATGAMAAWTVG